MNEDIVERVSQLATERLKIDYQNYRQTLAFLGANAPIGVLCLGNRIEAVLKKNRIDRIYDLISFRDDFREIKGLGKRGVDLLTARFDEWFAIGM